MSDTTVDNNPSQNPNDVVAPNVSHQYGILWVVALVGIVYFFKLYKC